MEQRDYTGIVPFTPPEGLAEWSLKKAQELQSDVLLYKVDMMNRRRVLVWCSACGETSEAIYVPAGGGCGHSWGPDYAFKWEKSKQRLFDGETAACPYCCKRSRVYHASRPGKLGQAWPMTVHRIGEGADSTIAIVWWSMERRIVHNGAGYEAVVETHPYEAYVVEKRKLVRLKGYWKGMGYAFSWERSWHQTKSMNDCCGTAELVYPWDKRLLEGTVAENCKLDLYLGSGADCRPVQYLSCWTKHRNVENLIVHGFGRMFTEMLNEHVSYSSNGAVYRSWKNIKEIDWKQNRPSKMLGLTRDEVRCLKQLKLGLKDLNMWRELKKAGIRLKLPEDLVACRECGSNGVIQLLEDSLPVMKIVRYILRQIRKYPQEKSKIGVSVLKDYWRLAEQAGEALCTEEEKYPQHLVAAHDAMLERVQFQKSLKREEGFRKQYEKLSLYSFAADGLLIRPVRDEMELIQEGKLLHHCVATYAERHAEGKRVILLIRMEEEPEKPFYTLNLDTESLYVIQNHGLRNCGPTKEVQAFVDLWLEHIHHLNRKVRKTA